MSQPSGSTPQAQLPGWDSFMSQFRRQATAQRERPTLNSASAGNCLPSQTGALLVIDFGGGPVLRVDPFTGASSVFMPRQEVRDSTASPSTRLATFMFPILQKASSGRLAQRRRRNSMDLDPLLTTAGVPPFGGNGSGVQPRSDDTVRCKYRQ